MAMRRPVRIPRIRRERPKLRPAPRDGLHRAQRERPEVRVERVQRRAGRRVARDGGGEELGGDFHVAEGVDEVELAFEVFGGVDDDWAAAPEDVGDDPV